MLSTEGDPEGKWRACEVEDQKLSRHSNPGRLENPNFLKPVLYFSESKHGADASGKNLSEPTQSK
jgi:hypothetical protein